jgi:hypothetical protein
MGREERLDPPEELLTALETMNAEQVARVSGVDAKTVRRVVRRERKPDGACLLAIAAAVDKIQKDPHAGATVHRRRWSTGLVRRRDETLAQWIERQQKTLWLVSQMADAYEARGYQGNIAQWQQLVRLTRRA